MLGSLRFKPRMVRRAGRAGKRGHYGGGVGSAAQPPAEMNRGSSPVHIAFIRRG